MTETIDRKNSVIKHEIMTDGPEKAREYIESLDCLKQSFRSNRVNRYIAEVNGPVEIISSPTKVILRGKHASSLSIIEEQLHVEEWETK